MGLFVGLFVCGSVTTITRNCVYRSSPNWVCRWNIVTISTWLNFGRLAPPGRGSAAGRKFWLCLTTASAQCLRLSERFLALLLSAPLPIHIQSWHSQRRRFWFERTCPHLAVLLWACNHVILTFDFWPWRHIAYSKCSTPNQNLSIRPLSLFVLCQFQSDELWSLRLITWHTKNTTITTSLVRKTIYLKSRSLFPYSLYDNFLRYCVYTWHYNIVNCGSQKKWKVLIPFNLESIIVHLLMLYDVL